MNPNRYFPVRRQTDMIKGFRDFVLRGNVIDLAVAVVIGGAFQGIVNGLVKDIINPFIGLIGGKPDFSGVYLTIGKSKFMVGDFFNQVVSFLIIASVIYFFVVVPMNRVMARLKPKTVEEPAQKTCPECLSEIPSKAKRCKYCTAAQKK
jgi:large conductance mechanosensitive channel